MQVNGQSFTTIWYQPQSHAVAIIDQTRLPHHFEIIQLQTQSSFCTAIASMQVRGAPLIGITAAFGFAFALMENGTDPAAQHAYHQLLATRPTAINLRWALDRVWHRVQSLSPSQRGTAALAEAALMRDEDIRTCKQIGEHGLGPLREIAHRGGTDKPLQILTHCNAGWLATVDWGTALAPIYQAQAAGMNLHIWVDETRPRNQGASLTAWELQQQGIPHTVIVDNTGGHLMQQGMIDLCIIGSDRTTANGDVCNKIGSYLKALAARDNDIPFFVALPESTIDWTLNSGRDIPIEERDGREVTHISGVDADGVHREIQLVADSPAANYAFDITPARLVTALITEHGIYSPDNLAALAPSQR